MSYQAVTNQENQILINQDDSMPLVSAAVDNLNAIPNCVHEDMDMCTNGVTIAVTPNEERRCPVQDVILQAL